MAQKILIWIDDDRIVPTYMQNIFDNIIVCRTYKQAIAALNDIFRAKDCDKVYVDFDHDIQCKETGYDIAKYIVKHHFPIAGFSCHSFNPVGRKNIEDLLLHYGYKIGI